MASMSPSAEELVVGPVHHGDLVLGGERLGPMTVTGGDRSDLDARQDASGRIRARRCDLGGAETSHA